MVATKYLQMIFPVFNTKRTKEIFGVNPTITPVREEATNVKIHLFSYNATEFTEKHFTKVEDCFPFSNTSNITWINIDGLRKEDVEKVCQQFKIHFLLSEDILSVGQRPKMDEVDDVMFCLLNMLYTNKDAAVETEQISIALGKNFVISFQDDADRDVFDSLRSKLRVTGSKLRQTGADYLCYSLIDMIVDHYFVVMEKLSEQIEFIEEEIIRFGNARSLARINSMRKELIVLKRNVSPVRELVNGFIRSDNDLLEEKTTKYFKDVYDHIVQATDLVENYRDMMTSMQDLYLNKANMRLNEVMKVMAIVTCLMAPATVIGGIFGMNFDSIPAIHNKYGFLIAVSLMLFIPLWMIRIFRKRGWF
ncbi:magnesium transporter [Filimonas lacunae]|uniref:Magnesium transport protein CorA n=1 Tax=Filimonas lacunae TaxID=477680 RepID=A0A173MQI1_9BACT|nr:magnesium/cobalt transporter CorA [Filimonas lacunae]BAV09747.1 magnesium and cobalt transport protein CorA [Filimonas lacunae]SIS78343.1 magnesium transporter [Filimonas lacunae]